MEGPSENARYLASFLEQFSSIWIESWHSEKIDVNALANLIDKYYEELP